MKNRKPKNNKYQHLSEPQKEVDYHGLDPFLGESGIRQFTQEAIDRAQVEGVHTIRLIVGKGLHSKNGAVIKPIVQKFLQELQQSGEIRSFGYDKNHGVGQNEGALVVKL